MSSVLPHHTPADLDRLQTLLDASHARAGEHLRGIHTAEARVSAAELVHRLPDMHVMVVASVSVDGRPFTGPVDAFLHHGRIIFGTAPHALRARHLAARPAISVTYVDGERLVLTMHGTARRLDMEGGDGDVRGRLATHYGPGWEDWGAGSPYFVVEPERVFAADMAVHASTTG